MDYDDPYFSLDEYHNIPQQAPMPNPYYQMPFDPAILLGYTPISVEIQQGVLYLDGHSFGSIDDIVAEY
jgi:hypothetical protein